MGEDTERGRKRGKEDDLLSMKMYEAISLGKNENLRQAKTALCMPLYPDIFTLVRLEPHSRSRASC
jgi:hypothetical protein